MRSVLKRLAALGAFLGAFFGATIFNDHLTERRRLEAASEALARDFINSSILAARNAAGTYSLPSGNPVVAGTTISTTWANTTMSDLGTELTDSLNRSGKGAMLAPLQLSNGTSSLPSLTFGTDTDSGLYRAGAGDVRMQVDASAAQKWTSSGSTITPLLTLLAGATVTQSSANTAGITSTGTGTGQGGVFVGGTTNGSGVSATGGATNGDGVAAQGTGSGDGIDAIGGSTGAGGRFTGGTGSATGVVATGGSTNGVGIEANGTGSGVGLIAVGGVTNATALTATGGGTGKGGTFANGTAATGGTRRVAVALTNGDLDIDGVANATSTTAFKNKLTTSNLVKSWASITYGAATSTVNDAFNLSTAPTCASNQLTVTLPASGVMASSSYVVLVTASGSASAKIPYYSITSSSVFKVGLFDAAGTEIDLCTVSGALSFMVIGNQ